MSWRCQGEQAAGIAGLSSGSLLTGISECPWQRRWFGCRGTRFLCKHSCGTKSGAPWGDDKPEAAAERGAKCGATLCYAPAPPSWCQVLCGSRCGRTDAPLGFLKERKPSLPRTTGDQRELLSGPLGAAEGCSVQSKSN